MFRKSKPRKKDLLQQIEELKQQLSLISMENEILKQGYFDQFDRNNKEQSTSDFYDGVIDLPNLRSLCEGWSIYIRDWNEYRKLVQTRVTVVSIVGNYSKGKTFLLGLLSDQETPHGFNVNTQGVSIRYLRDKSDNNNIRPVIVLDTKGCLLPLEVSEGGEESLVEDMMAEKSFQKQMEEENRLKQILRDQDGTEDILHNFVLEEANIILIVVSDLTSCDQRLIRNITSKLKEGEYRKIIVVHNLFHAKTIQDVKNKLKEFIRPSFKLIPTIFSEFEAEKNHEYYVEIGPKNTLIHHVILAKNCTEAGDFYNYTAIKHLKACIETTGRSRPVDIIDAFHKNLTGNLPAYIRTTPNLEPNDIRLEKHENGQPTRLVMLPKKSFEFKPVITDELGKLRRLQDLNEFQPKYCLSEEIISDSERYLSMKIECPYGFLNIAWKVKQEIEDFRIQVRGIKPEEDIKKMSSKIKETREFGRFFVETEVYRKAQYRFDYDGVNEQPKRIYEDGMVVLKWRLRSMNEEWHSADLNASLASTGTSLSKSTGSIII